MGKKDFDPFADRLSRDIRNTLCHTMVHDLQRGQRSEFMKQCRCWLQQDLPDAHRAYIEDSRRTFERLFEPCPLKDNANPLGLAVRLWNEGMFFEVHEVVEHLWHPATGPRKQALKGFVQAAGCYVHHRASHGKAANGLALKAAVNLRSAAMFFGEIANLEELIGSLENRSAEAPRLAFSGSP